jgi:NAD(P)-dependent dehydrogenase (short-subunit alcohol dehydrogenase family)
MANIFPDGAAIVFGASGGIGKGVAIEFAKEGANVAVCYRSKKDVAEQVADEVRKLGGKASRRKSKPPATPPWRRTAAYIRWCGAQGLSCHKSC